MFSTSNLLLHDGVLVLMFYLIPYRAEQQRNQALENAEKLKEAFKDYKATISIKLKRVN